MYDIIEMFYVLQTLLNTTCLQTLTHIKSTVWSYCCDFYRVYVF